MRRLLSFIIIASLVVGVGAALVVGHSGGSSASKHGGYTGSAAATYDAARAACAQLPKNVTPTQVLATIDRLLKKPTDLTEARAIAAACFAVLHQAHITPQTIQMNVTTFGSEPSTNAFTNPP
jgi:hypothetical protein